MDKQDVMIALIFVIITLSIGLFFYYNRNPSPPGIQISVDEHSPGPIRITLGEITPSESVGHKVEPGMTFSVYGDARVVNIYAPTDVSIRVVGVGR